MSPCAPHVLLSAQNHISPRRHSHLLDQRRSSKTLANIIGECFRGASQFQAQIVIQNINQSISTRIWKTELSICPPQCNEHSFLPTPTHFFYRIHRKCSDRISLNFLQSLRSHLHLPSIDVVFRNYVHRIPGEPERYSEELLSLPRL